jgi:exonuclease III
MLKTYEIDILAIQEMRWIGQNILERKDCTVYYSCHDKTHFGTGFIVSKKIRDIVMDFQPISMRLCKLRLRGKFHNYSIVCVHAPTEEKSDHEKDILYELLERAQDSCPVHDVKIVIGDFNAKIGHSDNARPFVGKDSLHDESNNNGGRLTNYAVSQNMIIGSTKFPHKRIHKTTWRSPDGITMNQIDHVLIDKRHSGNLLDVRSYRNSA